MLNIFNIISNFFSVYGNVGGTIALLIMVNFLLTALRWLVSPYSISSSLRQLPNLSLSRLFPLIRFAIVLVLLDTALVLGRFCQTYGLTLPAFVALGMWFGRLFPKANETIRPVYPSRLEMALVSWSGLLLVCTFLLLASFYVSGRVGGLADLMVAYVFPLLAVLLIFGIALARKLLGLQSAEGS